MQVFLGCLQHVVRANVADAFAIGLPVVLLLLGELVICESSRDLAGSGEEAREDLDLVVLGRVEFLGADLVVLHALDFLDHDCRRLCAGGVTGLKPGREGARIVRTGLEARVCAVGQALI